MNKKKESTEIAKIDLGKLEVIEKKSKLVTSSRNIATIFGKRHDHVLRDIRELLRLHTDLKPEVTESTYFNFQNKEQPQYLITAKLQNILSFKYEFGKQSARMEFSFEKMLRSFFPNQKIISQMKILKYKVDFYLPFVDIIVEYDEKHHQYSVKPIHDAIRIDAIVKELSKEIITDNPWLKNSVIIEVVRVKEGEEIEGLRQLFLKIEEFSMNSVGSYMK